MITTNEQNLALSEIPANKREEAINRVGIVKDFECFAARNVREGGTRTQAIAVYSLQEGITQRTLQRWIYKYRDFGLKGLVDMRGRGGDDGGAISDEAFELFKSLYLDLRQPTLATCWQNICYENRRQNKGWTIPSLRVMYNIVEKSIPYPVRVLLREGQAAYDEKCAPYIQVDPDSIEPGQVWVGDHHQFNCWIRHKGQWIRPWLTAWEDMRSRSLVGWHISLSPNQTTIMFAFKQGVKSYGPPDSVKIDNGKDYDSEMWTGTTKAERKALQRGYIDENNVRGLYAMMGVTVSFAIPYHPQSKLIERFFDTLDCQFVKTIPTYCGKDTGRKPDYLNELLNSQKAIDNALDLQKFSMLFERYAKAYNSSSHSGAGMDGRSPEQVLAARTSRRVILDEVLDLLLQGWSREIIVRKNGVQFKGLYYGQFNADLLACQSKTVRLAYDPHDLRRVYVYDAATRRLITIAEQNQLINYGDAVSDEQLREAMRQKSRALKVYRGYRDSALIANMDLTDVVIRAMQEAKVVNEAERTQQTLRPVRTPLDGQLTAHKQLKARMALTTRPKKERLNLDLSLLKPKREILPVLELDLKKYRGAKSA
jgi:transposase InsO family protein